MSSEGCYLLLFGWLVGCCLFACFCWFFVVGFVIVWRGVEGGGWGVVCLFVCFILGSGE